jgi:hypothetical protein
MLPSGITTLLGKTRGGHPGLVFTFLQGAKYVPEPEYDIRTEGVLAGVPADRTGNGIITEVALAEKPENGLTAASAAETAQDRGAIRMSTKNIPMIFGMR